MEIRTEQINLVQDARRGDQSAFERLYTLATPLLRKSLGGFVQVEEDLDELVQETLAKAFSQLDGFQGGALFTTWCLSIGRNLALDRLRRAEVRGRCIVGSVDDAFTTCEGEQVARFSEPVYEDESYESRQQRVALREAILGLPEIERAAITLSLDGFSNEEIAAQIRRAVPTVKSMLSRSRKVLAQRLNPEMVA